MAELDDWTPPAAFPFRRFEGTSREVGRAHGRAFGDLVLGSIGVHRASIERSGLAWTDALALAAEGRSLMQLADQKLVDELDGIAEGVGVDPREIFAINFRVALTQVATPAVPVAPIHECTTAAALGAVTDDGHTLLAQNWDQASDLQANVVVIEQRVPGEPAILIVTEAGRLLLHGMNDAGIGLGGNTVRSDRPTRPERTGAAATVRRRALRHTTFDGAYRTLKDGPFGGSGNHMLAAASGHAVDVEVIPDDYFAIDPEKGIIAHANHFLHPRAKSVLVDTTPELYPSTIYREARVRSALTERVGRLTIADVQSALKDHHGHPRAVCSHPHKNRNGVSVHTLASTVMDLTDRFMLTAPGPACLGTYTEYRFS